MLITRYFFLWLLICPAVFSRCSNNQQQKRTREIIQKLCGLGEMRPVRCKSEAEDMKVQSPKFPKQEESRLLVLEMSYRIVSELLMKNASTEWKSSELQQLRDLLGHQRQFYTTCFPVASSTHAEVENWSAFWSSLSDFLSEKSFSACAWESARPVILQVMRGFYRSTTKSPKPIRSC
ncbi:interferon tau [Ictalurus punctatus]|uniref:Interferon tau n=1 Tax=Ictalurus punctatus TaxID=7998 RepID=A0A9F7TFY9_ICTPU|nr:interferon tau [Ictalurus punctatus]UOI84931.1 interferon phi f1 [Ictalurus punctatus]